MSNGERRVYGTHTARSDSLVRHIEAIWTSEQAARAHAAKRSTHPGVAHASVTVFTLDELGSSYPLVWFRHGHEDVNGRPFPTARQSG